MTLFEKIAVALGLRPAPQPVRVPVSKGDRR
jgi:hypothetical protein